MLAQVSQLLSSGPAPQQGYPTPAPQPPSYAGVVGHGRCGQGGGVGAAAQSSLVVPTFNIVPPVVQGGGQATGDNRGRDRANQGGELFNRSRSNSNKRRRTDEGSGEETAEVTRDRSQQKQKKFVVGTSNQVGRKMRSPPADIFVYGVHPDTSPEDIVQDLAFSDIIISTQDITVKSKEEAYLKSYKIS